MNVSKSQIIQLVVWFVIIIVLVIGFKYGNKVSSNSNTVSTNVNNFSISQFDVDYFLETDSEGRSTLKVIENITADFPNVKQNKGLVREIPKKYQDHSLSFKLISLERNGRPEPIYSRYEQNGFHVIETGTDEYVLGPQTYTFTYSLRDVTQRFADTNRDELYWNINGTGWRVPIRNLTARVHMNNELRSLLTGDIACYQGSYGSIDRCVISETDTGFVIHAENLSQRENATFAIGFEPQSFVSYQETWFEKILPWYFKLFVITSIIGFFTLIILEIYFNRVRNRKKEITTIIPEYVPPRDASVLVSASIIKYPRAVFTAQLIDLAVRGYIKIIETKQRTFLQQADFRIDIIRDVTDLKEEEQEILKDMFSVIGIIPKVGDSISLKTLDNSLGFLMKLQDNEEKLKKLVEQYGLREKNEIDIKRFKKIGIIFTISGIVIFSPLIFLTGVFAFYYSTILRTLTDKGLELSRYLQGLKMYIKVAEKDRMNMLQSPAGVEKVGIDPTNTAQVIQLYEKLLPYAILFGQEKEWNKQLGKYYESAHISPNWYHGHSSIMTTASFNSMMSSLSSSISTASGSNSGGSGGGGFSGGGGGGGGGGGR